jgi:hypothetical protein
MKIYLMAWDGQSDLIGLQSQQPTYKELEDLVTEVCFFVFHSHKAKCKVWSHLTQEIIGLS